MKKKLSFTVKEFEKYKARIRREHQAELQRVRTDAFAKGLAQGRLSAINSVRTALLLPELTSELF